MIVSWRDPEYKVVVSEQQLDLLCSSVVGAVGSKIPIAIDVETTSATRYGALNCYCGWLLGISIATNKNEGYYIPLNHTKKGEKRKEQLPLSLVVEKLEPILSSGGLYLNHNIKFDYKFLWRAGIHLFPCFWDTMIASQMLNGDSAKSNKLKDLAPEHIALPQSKGKTFEEAAKGNAAEVDPVEFCEYAIDDVMYVQYLYDIFKPEIDKLYPKLFYKAEMPLIPVLAQAEMRGIRVDTKYFNRIKIPLEKCKKKIEKGMRDRYGININSPKQLGDLLNKQFSNLTFERTKKGNITTGIDALQGLKRKHLPDTEIHKLAKHTIVHRKIEKAISTYVEKFPKICHQYYDNGNKDYILHTNFFQIMNSGRLSSSPNTQNWPKDTSLLSVRKGFTARKGYKLIRADWKSAEYRIIAVASKDETMLKLFIDNPLDANFHTLTAQALFGKKEITPEEYHKGKTFNFSALYLATEYSISKTLDCSKDTAADYLANFRRGLKGYNKWTKQVRNLIGKQKYTETFFGRRRYLPPGVYMGMDEFWIFDMAVRELLNHTVQGTCADLLKFAMVNMTKKVAQKKLNNTYIINHTHDEIVIEAKEEDTEQASQIMKDVMEVKLGEVFMPVDIAIKDNFSKRDD